MALPLPKSYPPMDALLVAEIPAGAGWQYEPKWDGFRALVFRDGGKIELQSKKGQPLARYFPEIVEAVGGLGAKKFVLDGELVIPEEKSLSFDALLQRIHPSQNRIKKLSKETPAVLIVFDLLVGPDGKRLADQPLKVRREALEDFAKKYLKRNDRIVLSPATSDIRIARRWFSGVGGALDGVIAKRLDAPYQSGNRTGMVKVKKLRTADCVVGGFRYATNSKTAVGSLLLGLYKGGLLHHVGFCSSFKTDERKKLVKMLKPLIGTPGFTGNAPGGPSRWSTERSTEWQPLKTKLVVEIQYDHFTGGRFRHGTRFLRWRPDKSPKKCTMTQVEQESAVSPLKLMSA
ncbi:MAG TPA: ATP-dependent DNA ligase [Tepidisphaeraceae bacterium]|nr:ATP-dependent DNA ligase [Tepidisphaeraceae bacterium]